VLGLAACGSPSFQTHAALVVVALSPADGATGVPRDATQSACFSAPVQRGDVEPSKISVTDLAGAPVPGLVVGLEGDGRCVRLTHDPLAPSTDYLLHIVAGLRASDGSPALPGAAQGRFRTGAQ
jgi:hypothetical protein